MSATTRPPAGNPSFITPARTMAATYGAPERNGADLFAAGPVMPAPPGQLRAPSWADPDARPEAGQKCTVCWGRWFWCEATEPRRGWRCSCCVPAPSGLAVEEIDTSAPSAMTAEAGAALAEAQIKGRAP